MDSLLLALSRSETLTPKVLSNPLLGTVSLNKGLF